MGAKLSFELDSGKILAKLHRGACQTYPKVLFFNTGITDDANIAPEAVDKAKINFDMENNEYELGVIMENEMTLKLSDSLAASGVSDETIANVVDTLDEYLDKNDKTIDEMEDKEWKALCDEYCKKYKTEIEVDEFKEKVIAAYEEVHKKDKNDKDDEDEDEETEKKDGSDDAAAQEDKDTPITQNPDDKKAVNEDGETAKDVRKMDPEQNSENFDDMVAAMTTADDEDFTRLEKNARGDAAEAVKKNHDAVKKFMEKNMKDAAVYLQAYMKVFAGEDEAKKIKPIDIAVTYVPEDKADPYKIKKYEKYQIPALTDEQVRQEKIKQMKANPDATEFSYKNMCFKIAYTLDIGR